MIPKAILVIFGTAFGIVLSDVMMNVGFRMVGESGVSQGVVNAIIGVIIVVFCWLMVVYLVGKFLIFCIKSFKEI